LNAIGSGDIMGGFTEAAGALGLPVGLMSGMSGAFSAIKSGDMSSLTGAIQGLAGFDAGILGSVAGMADGLPLGGMGALGGMEVDIAESMNFVQSVTQLFECDPEPECSPNDEHTLDSGGSGAEEPNCASIAESANNAAQTKPSTPPKTDGEKPTFSNPSISELRAKSAVKTQEFLDEDVSGDIKSELEMF